MPQPIVDCLIKSDRILEIEKVKGRSPKMGEFVDAN
jgi:hypothetical protein